MELTETHTYLRLYQLKGVACMYVLGRLASGLKAFSILLPSFRIFGFQELSENFNRQFSVERVRQQK